MCNTKSYNLRVSRNLKQTTPQGCNIKICYFPVELKLEYNLFPANEIKDLKVKRNRKQRKC